MDSMEDSSIVSPSPTPTDPLMENINKEALMALKESLKKQLEEATKENKECSEKFENIIEAYDAKIAEFKEKTMHIKSQIPGRYQQYKEVLLKRDQALEDLRNVEQAFTDVHRKYERGKAQVESLAKIEKSLMEKDEEIQMMIYNRDLKYEALKDEAGEVLNSIHMGFTGEINDLDKENGKLAALIKRSELRVETMQSELMQKQKKNMELNQLADDLIDKQH